MLITDLPELEETDFYRLVLERGEVKGVIKSMLIVGRKLWGPEPAHLAERLSQLEAAQLEKLMDAMNLPNWQAFEDRLSK